MARDNRDTALRFALLDADGDGVVTWHDFEHRLLTLAQADPGIGSAGLFRVRTGFRALWRSMQAAMDTDDDNQITFAEYEAYEHSSAGQTGVQPGEGTELATAADAHGAPAVPAHPRRPAELVEVPLPSGGAAAADFSGYQPCGTGTVQSFLQTFWNPSGGWRYPEADGFARTADGAPVAFPSVLLHRETVDRYGREHGTYLAPVGTPVAARAIPPETLRHAEGERPWNYHRYEVLRDFSVLAGPTAPAFAQSGYGIQYKLKQELLNDAPERLTVAWLVAAGYLRLVDASGG
ncbi:glycohydrolase toxin TNT-related protein [Streptomyces sp. NBC_01016]|uniref:glycohydrolase toxin TNT-related protein n=1 Tax=Streptomyces sp. NBC_01016 TaxID=2903720 RepID=UPI00225159DE|nr:glycohydrolase toxin TNT-related protein [Streptomyces sp. NBC_01016]MCX4834566.1 glycohydrolase toxin TNT-related protein [Streptomyces sp. NBC_01016]